MKPGTMLSIISVAVLAIVACGTEKVTEADVQTRSLLEESNESMRQQESLQHQ